VARRCCGNRDRQLRQAAGDSKQHHPADCVTETQASIKFVRRFRKFDTGKPGRPRRRDEHENHQKNGDRRHIRIIADAIGRTVDETQISSLACFDHAEPPSTLE
jgi:hypothetical protein